jgi:DNA-binding NtrC family response regulator
MTRVFLHDCDVDLEVLYARRLARDGFAIVDDPSTADVLVVSAGIEGRQLVAEYPTTPLVVTSIYSRAAEPDLAGVAYRFLTKPFKLDRLAEAVSGAAVRGRA